MNLLEKSSVEEKNVQDDAGCGAFRSLRIHPNKGREESHVVLSLPKENNRQVTRDRKENRGKGNITGCSTARPFLARQRLNTQRRQQAAERLRHTHPKNTPSFGLLIPL